MYLEVRCTAQLKQLLSAALTITLGKQFPEQPPAKLVDETYRIKMDKALSNNPTESISNAAPNSHSRYQTQKLNGTDTFWIMLACRVLISFLAT